MRQDILDFYLKTSIYTNFFPFESYFRSLPDDVAELANILSHQVIHRVELIRSYINKPRAYENKYELEKIKEQYPWYPWYP